MFIIGIDPGLKGAIALLRPDGNLEAVMDMPVLTGAKGKTELNYDLLFSYLVLPRDVEAVAYIENVHAMPGQGVTSMFRFGDCFGAIKMAVAGNGLPRRFITPQAWKKHFKIASAKGAARGLATEIFPNAANEFARVKDDGRAEAALIARYGHETGK